MAARRMFALSITSSDSFIEMSLECQAVYFQLGMNADDDGFINSALLVIRAIGGTKEHIEQLINQKFLIRFDSGILLIRHWNLNNRLQKDRYHATIHNKERALVTLIDGIYYLNTEPECIQLVSSMCPQVSIGKESIDKVSEGESRETEPLLSFVKPSITELRDYANSIGYSNFKPEVFIAYYEEHGWYDSHTNKPIDWKKRIDSWKVHEKNSSAIKSSRNSFNDFEQNDYDFVALEKLLTEN